MSDIERECRNAARRHARIGDHSGASAYRYAAWLLRQALKDAS